MLHADWSRHRLNFNFVAITSRARMAYKDTYFVRMYDDRDPERQVIAESPLFAGLSAEYSPDYETRLERACRDAATWDYMEGEPCVLAAGESSIRFAFECGAAALRLGQGSRKGAPALPAQGPWTQGQRPVTINGLVWMGDIDTMSRRMRRKVEDGFSVIKVKIGALDFDAELKMLRTLRDIAGADTVIRLDANGAFTPQEAMKRLQRLASLNIHSIEQPLRPQYVAELADLCRHTPIPIALDESLIMRPADIDRTIDTIQRIRPQYLILKPSLCGGLGCADTLIRVAQTEDMGWWATSALESNIGLAALGAWVDTYAPSLPQGLGTGALYTNNIEMPQLQLEGQYLWYRP